MQWPKDAQNCFEGVLLILIKKYDICKMASRILKASDLLRIHKNHKSFSSLKKNDNILITVNSTFQAPNTKCSF